MKGKKMQSSRSMSEEEHTLRDREEEMYRFNLKWIKQAKRHCENGSLGHFKARKAEGSSPGRNFCELRMFERSI